MNKLMEPPRADVNHNAAPAPTENLAIVPTPPAAPAVIERAAFTRSRGLGFNAAQIRANTESLPEEHRQAVRWLFAHGMDKGDDRKRLAGRIKKHDNTLYRIFQGTYGAKLDEVVAEINTYRKLAEERDKVGRPPFIPTSLSQKIWDKCNEALTLQRMIPIIGDWQIGKTFALKAYQEAHNHGQTRLVRLPNGSGYRTFLEAFARACYSPASTSYAELRKGILGSLDSSHLVIFDEIDEPLAGRFSTGALQIYGFIREVFDERGCGVIMCGNHTFLDALQGRSGNSAWMKKIERRGFRKPLILPTTAPDEDLWAIAAHFGFDAPHDAEALQVAQDTVAKLGIGEFVTLLQIAKKISLTLGVAVNWNHFLKAAEEEGK